MKSYTLLLLCMLFVNCSNSQNAASSFIENVKSEDLSIFRNVVIEARNKVKKNYNYNHFYFFIKNDTLLLPSLSSLSSNGLPNDSIFKANVTRLAKIENVEEKDVFEFIEKIDVVYKKLNIINVVSNPKRGDFIEFVVEPNCKAYYIFDKSKIFTLWSDKFESMKPYNEEWYYDCSQ